MKRDNSQISFVSIFAIVIIVMLLFAGNCFGQINLQNPFKFNYQKYSTRYDITIHNEGSKDCIHDFVVDRYEGDYSTSCLVLHDSRGCPNNWEVMVQICRKCLRKEVHQEVRYYSEEQRQDSKKRMQLEEERIEEFKRLDSLSRLKK